MFVHCKRASLTQSATYA